MTTREEHIAACKVRATEYIDKAEKGTSAEARQLVARAYLSMTTCLSNHNHTAGHPKMLNGLTNILGGAKDPATLVRKARAWLDSIT